jgi:hypothetical protein
MMRKMVFRSTAIGERHWGQLQIQPGLVGNLHAKSRRKESAMENY